MGEGGQNVEPGGRSIDVVILAGGTCPPDLAELAGTEFRAEIPFRGRTMLQIGLDAATPFGDPVVVGGPAGSAPRQVPAGAHFIESVQNGLEAVTTDSFLILTADLPCVNDAAIRAFLDSCDPGAGLNYPIIPSAACVERFPGMKRTTLKLREGEFTGGNAGLVRTELMRSALPILHRAYAARKSPLKLAGIVGLGTLGRVIAGKVSPRFLPIESLEGSVSRFLGMPVRAVPCPSPELGVDIDSADQYRALLALSECPDRTEN